MSPPFSKFAQSVGGSTVVGMRRQADALEAKGMSVVDFGIGEPDFEAPPPVREAAIAAIRDGRGNYIDPRGLLALREAIAEFEADNHGHSVSPDQIVVTPGSYGALTVITRALLDPDADALVIEPGWGPYKALVKLTGAQAVGVAMGVDEGRFIIDAERLHAAVTPRTRAIVVNTPWNPTGRVLTRTELHAIAEVAEQHDLWIVADEVYSELTYGEARHVSIATLSTEIAGRSIIATSLSKSFAMTGWRLGYCIAPLEVAPLLTRINQYASRCPTSIVQYAAIAAFKESAGFVAAMRDEYTLRRDAIAAGLNAIDGMVCPLPEGTFYAFAQFAEAWGDSRDVAAHLLETAGVLLTPGSAYGPASKHHLRLSFATSLQTIEEGLARLHDALGPRAEGQRNG
ncbi:MAG: pyridoxal phosphate-dependent aminotransferase [Chromatiales bacterium]|jgi:aspartate aminotransferase|nr:pyridoxal phosphate-dependent aminotransferase [Chromatiales bacterium]